jgi:S-adenosylmethionine decarboxylase
MSVGTEWLVDAEECSPELLREIETVRRVCEEVVKDLDLRIVGEPMWHQFPQPGGVTGLYLLTESHLACHTFPETGIATFNLYCCRPRPAFEWEERLQALLSANRVTVRTATRGSEAASDHASFAQHEFSELPSAREVSRR